MRKGIHLSIVIPAYNEENRIGESLKKIEKYINNKKFKSEIIIVDDKSTDNTLKVIQPFKKRINHLRILKNDIHMNKGYSVKKGILNTKGKFIIFTDADLSTPINEADNLITELEKGYDIAIGSRRLKKSKILSYRPLYRKIAGDFFNFITRVLIIPSIRDTQCGFKAFTKEAAFNLFPRQTLNDFSFDLEIIFIAKKFNYTIKEVPVTWCNSPLSRLIFFKDGIKMIFDIFRIIFNSILGKY